MGDNTIVYSTEKGRITPDKKQVTTVIAKGDGIVRVQRQVSGRKGKGVTVVTGLALSTDELSALAAELKRRCGCGGTVKEGVIEIQGDKRDELKQELEKKGYYVKLAGG